MPVHGPSTPLHPERGFFHARDFHCLRALPQYYKHKFHKIGQNQIMRSKAPQKHEVLARQGLTTRPTPPVDRHG